jgi:hypothetical protein
VSVEVKSKNSTIGSIFLWLITPEEAFIDLDKRDGAGDEREDS